MKFRFMSGFTMRRTNNAGEQPHIFEVTMKNIFPLILAFLLFFTFSCAGTPEADNPPDLARFNSPVEEIGKIGNFEEFEEADGLAKIAETDETVEIAELDEINELADIIEIEEINEIAELEEIDEIDGLAEIVEIVEIEEPQELEVWDTGPLADEKPLIVDIFNDEDFYESVELAEVEPAVQDEPKIEPDFEEDVFIAEEPQIIQAPQIVQAPPQPEPVREQEMPRQAPVQITQPAPIQQPSQTPVPFSLLSPAAAPSVTRDIAAEQDAIPSRNEPPVLLRDEPPVPARQGIITPQNDEVVFSRIVRATVGQIVEIPFMGTNWVYLGELASRRGIAYDSYRREPEGQSIIFRAEETGTYVLKFYREVFVRGYILNDYVQVIVGEAPSIGAGWFNPPIDRGRVVANPRWPSALNEAEILRGGSPSTSESNAPSQVSIPSGESVTAQGTPPAQGTTPAQENVPTQGTASAQSSNPAQETVPTQGTASVQGSTPAQGTIPVQETVPYQPPVQPAAGMIPEDMMQRAKEAFDGGNVAAAIALLDQFREYYPSGSDEAYWLYGQFYEANSPSRDILLALDYYRRLVREYPQSSRVSDARRRVAYLERFYINIQ